MAEKVPFDNFVSPVCLPEMAEPTGRPDEGINTRPMSQRDTEATLPQQPFSRDTAIECYTTGWGYTGKDFVSK